MKKAKQILSLILALTLCFALCSAAFADDETPKKMDYEKVTIEKTIRIADKDASHPEEETFTFVFKPVAPGEIVSGVPVVTPGAAVITKAAEIANKTIGFTGEEKYTVTDAKTFTTNTMEIIAAELGLEDDGVYEWTVTEQKGTTEGMTYDSSEYYFVVVKDSSGGKTSYTCAVYDSENAKSDKMAFENLYNKKIDPEYNALSVSKTIIVPEGAQIDETKSFTFTATVNKPDVCTDTKFTYQLGNNNFEAEYNVPFTFTLKHGEELVARNLPEGATYTITESGEKNYKASAVYGDYTGTKDGDGEWVKGDGEEVKASAVGESLTVPQTGTVKIGNQGSYADFTNTMGEEPSPTGLLISNLPYIALVVVAAAGIAVYFAARKRKAYEE